MKIRYFLLLPFLCWLNTGIAQNYIKYYEYVNEAEYWMYKQEYQKAIRLYLEGFKKSTPLGKDAYQIAKCYALEGKKKYCKKWLMKSTRIPTSFAGHFMLKSDQKTIFKTIFGKELESFATKLKNKKKKTDLKYKDARYFMLFNTVDSLLKEDQKYRCGTNTLKDEYKVQDSLVQNALLKITQKYGYPGYLNIGTDIGNVILVHVNKTRYPIFKKIMLEEVEKGNLLPYGYAEMLDRFEWKYVYNKEKNDCFLYQLYTKKLCQEEHYEEVVERRKEIGLSIYFSGPRKKPFEPYKLLPWVNDEFIKKHSLLNKKE